MMEFQALPSLRQLKPSVSSNGSGDKTVKRPH
jgi:hypothetical protein